MKILFFILIVLLVLTIYTLANYYIFRRLLLILPETKMLRKIIIIAFWIIAYSFLAGRLLERISVTVFSDILVWIGSFWLAIMLYAIVILIDIDILRLANHFFNFLPDFITKDSETVKRVLGLCVIGFISVIVLAGFINSRNIVNKEYSIKVNKNAGNIDSLKIVMFSDVHLGTVNGKKFAKNIVDNVNALKPDVILIPGDIIDEDIAPVLEDGICEELRRFKSKYGVYGTTGNHEYIGGSEIAVDYLENNGIKMLRDTSVLIDSSFYLVGREDRSSSRFGYERKSLSEILNSTDTTRPLILLDHQPFELQEAQANNVDLQLSGHTHNGQLWPINFVTDMIYELAWGYKQIGNTHYYVSCGVGGWGPPVRTTSRPEIVTINLKFE